MRFVSLLLMGNKNLDLGFKYWVAKGEWFCRYLITFFFFLQIRGFGEVVRILGNAFLVMIGEG